MHKRYKVKHSVSHDNCNYEAGQLLVLEAAAAGALLAIQAIEEIDQPDMVTQNNPQDAPQTMNQIVDGISRLELKMDQVLMRIPAPVDSNSGSPSSTNSTMTDETGSDPANEPTSGSNTDEANADPITELPVETAAVNSNDPQNTETATETGAATETQGSTETTTQTESQTNTDTSKSSGASGSNGEKNGGQQTVETTKKATKAKKADK